MKARIENLKDNYDKRTQAAIIQVATDEFNRQKRDFLDMVFDIILWTMHEELGFGVKRLKRFYAKMYEHCYVTREKYELVGCEKLSRPMSDKIRQQEAKKGWTYPEWVRFQLDKIGWNTDQVEKEMFSEYISKGGF